MVSAIDLTDEDIRSVEALISRLRDTPVLSDEKAEAQRRVHLSEAMQKMRAGDLTYGVATGAPSHLVQGEEHFRSEMKRMQDRIEDQIRITSHGLDQWFGRGEWAPPFYPYRIAIILRKAKRPDLEVAFINAHERHFPNPRMADRLPTANRLASKMKPA